MSDVPSILSYQQVTEPDVRTPRAALGAALLALEALLILGFRAGSRALGVGNFSRGIMGADLAIGVYGMLSICVPFAAYFLASAKLPRLEAGRIVGRGARRLALALACAYCGLRLLAGACRIAFYGTGMLGTLPDSLLHLAIVCEVVSPVVMFALLVAAWLYMADLAARLARGPYVTLATALLGMSMLVVAAIFMERFEMFLGHATYPLIFRGPLTSLGDDGLLCALQLAYWTITAVMLRAERRR